MSLEAVIQENTTAIRTLIDLLSRGDRPQPLVAPPQAPTPRRAVEQVAPAPEEPKPPVGITYEDLKKLVLRVGEGKSRAIAIALLQRFGVERLPEARESQWPDIAAMARAILEDDYDPRESEPIEEETPV
jgi:hypothetical protein